jgi:glutathione S-transferase
VPVIEPGREDLKELKGIHLWHAGMSNCSQRCRITLSELGQSFASHIVDLRMAENATEEFQQINPNGVVPALVHDGMVIVNSVDILAYLDETFGGGSLRPAELEDQIALVLDRADKSQAGLKYCTFEFFFKHGPRQSEEVYQRLVTGLKSEWLRNFHAEARAGFSRERLDEMVGDVHEDILWLEDILKDGRKWLAGDQFTIADIAWMPNVHRYDILRWPLERYPLVTRWFKAASARDSYKDGLEGWEPKKLFDTALASLDERRASGDGIENYGPLAMT